MHYPLQLSFKILALARQLSVTDVGGNLLFYVKQKAFKLKEAVTVFADLGQTRALYTINADRVLDFSARYRFADNAGTPLGSVKRHGMKSIWKAQYDIMDGEVVTMTVREENPWIKLFDGLFSEIPIAGIFSGYLLNPAYVVTRPDGTRLMRLVKRPALFEGKYIIEKHGELTPEEETRLLLGLTMIVLLERGRG